VDRARQAAQQSGLRALRWWTRRPGVSRLVFRAISEAPGGSGATPALGQDDFFFLAYCLLHRHESASQLLQDLWVSYESNGKAGGYFVEFGADDGLLHSNTLCLERQLGWRGILAEPNLDCEPTLRRERNARIDTRCVWPRSGETVELLVTRDAQLSTIREAHVDDRHTAARMTPVRSDLVPTISLHDLLEEHLAPRDIDYLSVDTEGSELAILRTFDFRSRNVRLISVEHNHRADERAIDQLMTTNGYERRFRQFSDFDAWYRRIS